jgi:hypothetical protein
MRAWWQGKGGNVGLRFAHPNLCGLGAAWEREYDGKARASIHGHRLDTPDLKGDTAVLEAGFVLTPATSQNLTLELGVQGHAGKREGVTGSFRVNYRF